MNDFGLLVAEYNSALPTLADGDKSELQVDSNGRLLVQADVTVLMDFLGLNGAGDSSNALIAGTEDGTGAGTAHAVRVDTDGSLLTKVWDGTEQLDVTQEGQAPANALEALAFKDSAGNLVLPQLDAQGRLPVDIEIDGTSTYAVSDDLTAGEDGLIAIDNAAFTDLCSIAVGAGEQLNLYGWQFSSDKGGTFQIVTDDGVDVKVYKVAQSVSSMPNYQEHWGDGGRIEITGASGLSVKVQAQSKQGSGNATASIHSRKVV